MGFKFQRFKTKGSYHQSDLFATRASTPPFRQLVVLSVKGEVLNSQKQEGTVPKPVAARSPLKRV